MQAFLVIISGWNGYTVIQLVIVLCIVKQKKKKTYMKVHVLLYKEEIAIVFKLSWQPS